MIKKGVLWMAVAVLSMFLFGGCATIERKKAASTEDLLIAAGFTTKNPPTAQDQANIETMKPLKVVRTTKDGQTVYIYPDPYNCKCVYVGNEQQYAEYRRLAIEKNIAETNLAAAEMWQPGPPYWGWWW